MGPSNNFIDPLLYNFNNIARSSRYCLKCSVVSGEQKICEAPNDIVDSIVDSSTYFGPRNYVQTCSYMVGSLCASSCIGNNFYNILGRPTPAPPLPPTPSPLPTCPPYNAMQNGYQTCMSMNIKEKSWIDNSCSKFYLCLSANGQLTCNQCSVSNEKCISGNICAIPAS